MDDEKLPAELRLKLLEAERQAASDYPDWRKGRKAMLAAVLPGMLIGVLAVGVFRASALKLLYGAVGGGMLTALAALLFAACRPPRRKKQG